MASYSFENISYDNDLFYPRDTVNYLIRGTQTESTNAWTGNLPGGISSYSDGFTIDYFLPQECIPDDGTHSNNVTLNLGGAGAYPVYLGNLGPNSEPTLDSYKVYDQYPQYSIIRLTYVEDSGIGSSSAWKASAYVPGEGGTVTSIATGAGLVGGPVSTSGTIKAKLKSETPFINQATAAQEVATRIYPVAVDSDGYLAVNVPWTDITNVKQDGISGSNVSHYAVCATAATTAEKIITISPGTPTLEAGLRVIIKFSNANTADSPKLNINSLGAKNIYHNNSQITTSDSKYLLSGTVELIYDGTQWQFVGNYNYDRGAFVLNITKSINNDFTASQSLSATITAIDRGDIISAKTIHQDGFSADLEYLKIDSGTVKLYYLLDNQKFEYTFTSSGITEEILNIPTIQVVDWTVD